MTEPTAEQIAAEMPRAREALGRVRFSHPIIGNDVARSVALAMARVRIEAHAAGRDAGLGEAAGAVRQYAACTRGPLEADICDEMADAIRALLGRT